MPEITLSIPGAIVTHEVIAEIREALRPFTLWPEYRTLERSDEPVGDMESHLTRENIQGFKRSARESIERGGQIDLAELSINTHDGSNMRWTNDENAPLELIDSAHSSHVAFEARMANLRVTVGPDPYQTRVSVNTNFGIMNAFANAETEGYEATTIAEALRSILNQTVDPVRLSGELRPFRVFIGHGGDTKWKVVRDFVAAADYEVSYFEGGDRLGQSTFEVVEGMISEASVALIVMTGVDRLENGGLLARQNVVHELGFAHGRLGARHTLILLEDGTIEPSNIAGVTQVRFPNGDANETKEVVLAALANRKRERDEAPGFGYGR